MGSFSASNTTPERWEKIVKGADTGRHPFIMIDDEKLVTVGEPGIAGAKCIQTFLADVFIDGDNEWFNPADNSVDLTDGQDAEDNGQHGSSKQKEKSRAQKRADDKKEKTDKGLGRQRAEISKEIYTHEEWAKIAGKASTEKPSAIFVEGGKLVATGNSLVDAERTLQVFVNHVLGHNKRGINDFSDSKEPTYKLKGTGYSYGRS